MSGTSLDVDAPDRRVITINIYCLGSLSAWQRFPRTCGPFFLTTSPSAKHSKGGPYGPNQPRKPQSLDRKILHPLRFSTLAPSPVGRLGGCEAGGRARIALNLNFSAPKCFHCSSLVLPSHHVYLYPSASAWSARPQPLPHFSEVRLLPISFRTPRQSLDSELWQLGAILRRTHDERPSRSAPNSRAPLRPNCPTRCRLERGRLLSVNDVRVSILTEYLRQRTGGHRGRSEE